MGTKDNQQEIKKLQQQVKKLTAENEELKQRCRDLSSAEKEALELSANLTALIENTDDFILFSDENAKPILFNSAYARIMKEMLGIDMRPGFQPHTIIPDDEARAYWDNLHQRVLGGEKFSVVFPFDDGKSGIRYFEHSFNPVIENGKTRGFSEYTREITEKKTSEDELQRYREKLESLVEQRTRELIGKIELHEKTLRELHESREKYRLIFDHSPLGIVHFNGDGIITDCNKKMLEIFKTSKDIIIGFNLIEALPENDIDIVHAINSALTGNISSFEGEYHFINKPGSIPIRTTISSINTEEGTFIGAVGIVEDITSIKRAEEELLKTSKIESLGIFAGGIAHDFNNLLTAIIGNLSLVMLNIDKNHENHELLSNMEKASLSARDLTQQLLTFSRGGEPIRKSSSIDDVLRENADFVLRGTKVLCRYDIPETIWYTLIDAGQIGQVVRNLVINSRQAMPEGGQIDISAANESVNDSSLLPVKPGEYVKIIIRDRGTGISAENLVNIFDPYFTTKENGSGLGLAISYSIINKHGGYISVDSKEDTGTAFTIYLPAARERTKEEVPREKMNIAERKKILVMDDNSSILEVLKKMLSTMGCEVSTASHGREALEIYRDAMENDMPYDAVIMDLTIPGKMGGIDAIRHLKEINPDIKAIVSSGYSTDPVMANYQDYGFSGVIIKPYRFNELKNVLSKILT